MPACVKLPDPLLAVLLLTLTVTSACGNPATAHRFELQRVDANWSSGRMSVTLHQSLTLSIEARRALQHGIPLTVQVELVIRNSVDQVRLTRTLENYEIRFLPLSNYYQLTLPGGYGIRTFPRLRHLLADLSVLRVSVDTGALPSGEYEVLARTHLDMRKIPPPMRLPTMFSLEWRHDSEWSAWPLKISPQA